MQAAGNRAPGAAGGTSAADPATGGIASASGYPCCWLCCAAPVSDRLAACSGTSSGADSSSAAVAGCCRALGVPPPSRPSRCPPAAQWRRHGARLCSQPAGSGPPAQPQAMHFPLQHVTQPPRRRTLARPPVVVQEEINRAGGGGKAHRHHQARAKAVHHRAAHIRVQGPRGQRARQPPHCVAGVVHAHRLGHLRQQCRAAGGGGGGGGGHHASPNAVAGSGQGAPRRRRQGARQQVAAPNAPCRPRRRPQSGRSGWRS